MFTDSNESNGDNDENSKLLTKSSSSFRSSTMDHHYRTTDTSETVFDIYNQNNQNSQSKQHLSDEEDLKNDTNFVVNAMNQSHESLRKFVSK